MLLHLNLIFDEEDMQIFPTHKRLTEDEKKTTKYRIPRQSIQQQNPHREHDKRARRVRATQKKETKITNNMPLYLNGKSKYN